jgi:hypothetical protein
MRKIDSEITLRSAIIQLESQRADEEKKLKEQFLLAYESVKPVNLILSTFKDASESKELKTDILNTGIGLASGYLSKILFQAILKNPFKGIIGTAIQFGITNAVTKNPEAIKALGSGLLKIIRHKPVEKTNGVVPKINRRRLDLI